MTYNAAHSLPFVALNTDGYQAGFLNRNITYHPGELAQQGITFLAKENKAHNQKNKKKNPTKYKSTTSDTSGNCR